MPFPYTFPFCFADIDCEVTIPHQSDVSIAPYLHLQFVKGAITYDYYSSRILSIDVHQDPFRDDAVIVLANYDGHFNDLDLRGYILNIYFGITAEGYDKTVLLAPQKVRHQIFQSMRGVLLCVIESRGMLGRLADDHANIGYAPIGTAKSIVNSILAATLTPYDHCEAYTVVWHGDTGLSGITLHEPHDAFFIHLNETRLNAVRTLMDLSNSFMRPENDSKLHIRVPKTTGDAEWEFALDGHSFYYKVRSSGIVLPNRVEVTCETLDRFGEPQSWSGYAEDAASVAAWGSAVKYFHKAYDLSSDAEATAMAQSILNNIIANQFEGEAKIPVNLYLQVLDRITVTDAREGTETTGNVGYIDWHYSPGKYYQKVGLGGWLNRRRAMRFVQDVGELDKPVKREFLLWFTAALPATYLKSGQYIIFGIINVPKYRTLFVKAYGLIDDGNEEPLQHCRLRVVAWDADPDLWTDIAAIGSPIRGNVYYNGKVIDVYDSYDAGGTPVAFVVENDTGDTIENVTAFVAYDCQYIGGVLP